MSLNKTEHNRKKLRILCLGERTGGPAPMESLARTFESNGWQVSFVDPTGLSGRQWISRVLRSDILISISYNAPSDWFISHVRMAAMLGKPLVRWWVGTDVLNVTSDKRIAVQAKKLTRISGGNVVVAPHLQTELSTAGIQSLVASIPGSNTGRKQHSTVPAWNTELARSVLVYLPDERADFYGAATISEIAFRRPDITFYLVASSGSRFEHHPNVVGLGWLEDMSSAYNRTGCLLRITEHDGLPRMVQEALSRGRYVIYSWPLAGCIFARKPDEVESALEEVSKKTEPNFEGQSIYSEKFDTDRLNKKIVDILLMIYSKRFRRIFSAWLSLFIHFF